MSIPLAQPLREPKDLYLITKIVSEGDRKSLDLLVREHEQFIYNLAWKMTRSEEDAKDLTQEILIKVISNLSKFQGKSAFRTWLYRIVVNECLAFKAKISKEVKSFSDFEQKLDSIPNSEPTEEEKQLNQDINDEIRIACMMGMLMCLDQEQRLVYIFGDIFNVDHQMGADIFNISAQNFRVKLHRARKDLYTFMDKKCGLVNKSNPCRCSKKAKTMKDLGKLDSTGLVFNTDFRKKVSGVVNQNHQNAPNKFEEKYQELFQDHPYKEKRPGKELIDALLKDRDLKIYFG